MSGTLEGQLYRRVTRLQRRYGMNSEEATDIVHEALAACLDCLRRRYPADAPDSLLHHLNYGFLDVVIQKRVADHYRHQRCQQRAMAECAKASTPCDVERQAATLLLAGEIWDALPENCREVVYLRLYEQCPWAETAQATGLSVSAVKMRFQRGIEHARKNLLTACDESPLSNDCTIEEVLADESAHPLEEGETD